MFERLAFAPGSAASGAPQSLNLSESGLYVTNPHTGADAVGDAIIIHATAEAEL